MKIKIQLHPWVPNIDGKTDRDCCIGELFAPVLMYGGQTLCANCFLDHDTKLFTCFVLGDTEGALGLIQQVFLKLNEYFFVNHAGRQPALQFEGVRFSKATHLPCPHNALATLRRAIAAATPSRASRAPPVPAGS